MKLSRIGLAVASVGKRIGHSPVGPWTWGSLLGGGVLGVAALLCVSFADWRLVGWRNIGVHAGVFAALAAVMIDSRRPGISSLIDLSVAVWACLLEVVAGSSLTEACIGVAASAAGWSLGRGALTLSKLYASIGASALQVEVEAVNWFTALQRTSPERFDWNGLERWMRAHPSHRDAYERVEQVWYADPVVEAAQARRPLREAFGGLPRMAAVTKLGLWLAPTYANRVLVFSAAVALSAAAIYV
jgi:hypothetical protein